MNAEPASKPDHAIPRDANGRVLPGQSLNPAGRAKQRESWGQTYSKLLDCRLPKQIAQKIRSLFPELEPPLLWRHGVAAGTIRAAERGKVQAVVEIADRTDGKVAQAIQVQAVQLQVVDVAPGASAAIEAEVARLLPASTQPEAVLSE